MKHSRITALTVAAVRIMISGTAQAGLFFGGKFRGLSTVGGFVGFVTLIWGTAFMRRITALGIVAVTMAWGSIGHAGFTSASAVSTTPLTLTLSDSTFIPGLGALSIISTQSTDIVSGSSNAGLLATAKTDTPLDPTLRLANSVTNDTGFTWNSYGVDLSMPISFSISSPYATNSTVLFPVAWSTPTFTQPVPDGLGHYVGHIVYQSGTPIAIGEDFDFGYRVTFDGLMSYQVNQIMTINPPPVPEPGTLGLLLAGLGGMGLFRLVRRRRRATA